MLIYELKKALKSPGFKFALIISAVIVMMDYIIILMTMSIYMTLLDLLKIKRLEMILTFYVT